MWRAGHRLETEFDGCVERSCSVAQMHLLDAEANWLFGSSRSQPHAISTVKGHGAHEPVAGLMTNQGFPYQMDGGLKRSAQHRVVSPRLVVL